MSEQRLIDANALKEDLFIKFGNQLPNGLLDEIDNAPTVEPICPYLSDDEVKQPCLQAPCERPKVKDDVSCQYCKYDDKASTDYPCNICKNNHPNMFEWKEDNK